MRVQRGLIGLIVVLQAVLFVSHFIVYETWTFSPARSDIPGTFWVRLVLGLLSVSFVAASLLAFRYTTVAVRMFYTVAAVWLGFLTFLFFAAVFAWIVFGIARLAALNVNFHRMVEWLFGAAVLAGAYGVFNAGWTRITRTTYGSRICRRRGLGEGWRSSATCTSGMCETAVFCGGWLQRF